MRAISVWQPWAHWLVSGVKAIETRGRPIRTLVGERVVVHATASEPKHTREQAVLAAREAGLPELDLDALPRGQLIGSVRVIDCVRMTPRFLELMRSRPVELALGDYAVGRWAFAVTDPVRFAQPVPWRGAQGVFMVPDEFGVPDEVVRRAEGARP